MSSTEERVDELERKVNELNNLVETLMLLAAKHPIGRQVLRKLGKAGGG